MPAKQVPLDMVLLSLHDHETGAPQVALNVEPPRIFSSARPASLLVFDGPPVLAPIKGTTLSTAVNTNWRVFHDSASHTWYMLNGGAWLSAPDASGPWWVAAKLPSAFSQLPNDVNLRM